MKPGWKTTLLLVTAFLLAAAAIAQFQGEGRARGQGGGFGGGRGGGRSGEGSYRATEVTSDRGSTPDWPLDKSFPRDVFTFARIKYHSSGREQTSHAWYTDYRDADLNLSYRLQQMTSLKINPEPQVVELTDPKLFNYPWVFMSGAGWLVLTDEEAKNLRKYLLNGGFLMVDDFWGQDEWDGWYQAIKQALPDLEPVDLPRSHPIFNCLFPLPENLSLQTPNMGQASRNRGTGVTWEEHGGGNSRDLHFRAIFDKKGRMIVMICHNTDNGDGWEEESVDPWFFREFSEKKNFPLGINIIFYAMTH
ncbi:MAG: DUF4159 domain-containing protein [Opitutaceae bacterium]|nr:DUF4159 domain-containing protein [Verrucomicrobiales bacterium]